MSTFITRHTWLISSLLHHDAKISPPLMIIRLVLQGRRHASPGCPDQVRVRGRGTMSVVLLEPGAAALVGALLQAEAEAMHLQATLLTCAAPALGDGDRCL